MKVKLKRKKDIEKEMDNKNIEYRKLKEEIYT